VTKTETNKNETKTPEMDKQMENVCNNHTKEPITSHTKQIKTKQGNKVDRGKYL
jgi:hypothetical protein